MAEQPALSALISEDRLCDEDRVGDGDRVAARGEAERCPAAADAPGAAAAGGEAERCPAVAGVPGEAVNPDSASATTIASAAIHSRRHARGNARVPRPLHDSSPMACSP